MQYLNLYFWLENFYHQKISKAVSLVYLLKILEKFSRDRNGSVGTSLNISRDLFYNFEFILFNSIVSKSRLCRIHQNQKKKKKSKIFSQSSQVHLNKIIIKILKEVYFNTRVRVVESRKIRYD